MEQPNRRRYRPQVRHVGAKRRRGNDFGSPSSPSRRRSTDQGTDHGAVSDDKGEQHVKQESDARDGGDDDDRLWPQLPAHAHGLILDRLSVRERCRMRCVCKAWNNSGTLRSGRAWRNLGTWKSGEDDELWFIMARPPRYGPASKRLRLRPPKYGDLDWRFRACSGGASGVELARCPLFRPPLPNPHHSQLSALLGGRNCAHVAHMVNFLVKRPPLFHYLYLSSAGGLMSAMVCRPGAEDSYDFIIFNCLTGCVKVLPPPIFSSYWIHRKGAQLEFNLSMTLDQQDPSCYYLVLSPYLEASSYFEIFESRNTRWKAVRNCQVPFKSGQVLRTFVSAHPSSDELSVLDADFWWVESSVGGIEHCLLAYHARQDAWTSLLLPSIPREMEKSWQRLAVKYKGRLLLCLELVGMDCFRLGFGVWELQPATSTWVEIARTPEHLIRPRLHGFAWTSKLCADGGLFCMSLCNTGSQRCKPPLPLVFDMPRNAWYSLPLEKTTRKFGCISLLRPSFTASV